MVHIATIVPIALTVGANRIIPGIAIPYPLGNPELTKDEELKLRINLIKRALCSLQTSVKEQTVF